MFAHFLHAVVQGRGHISSENGRMAGLIKRPDYDGVEQRVYLARLPHPAPAAAAEAENPISRSNTLLYQVCALFFKSC